jgi:spore germination protein PF
MKGCDLMPVTICGPLQIGNVTTNAHVKFGDSLFLTPKTVSDSFAGSGTGNIGGGVIVNTVVNASNYNDIAKINQPKVGNN